MKEDKQLFKTIIPKAPFDFKKIVKRISSRKNNNVLIDEKNLSLQRIVTIDSQPMLLYVTFQGDINHPLLKVHIPTNTSQIQQEKLLQLVRHMFSTEYDLLKCYDSLSSSPYLKPLIHQFYGLRLVAEPDLFETIVKLMIYQQINTTFAAELFNRLITLTAEEVEVEGSCLPIFPSPESIARLSYDQLRRISFNQRKAEYVIDFAQSIVMGKINLNHFWKLTDEEIVHILSNVRGIGKWTIECTLLFGMGRLNILPAGDIALRKVIKTVWGLKHPPSEKDVEKLGLDWSPYKSYASYYLWCSAK